MQQGRGESDQPRGPGVLDSLAYPRRRGAAVIALAVVCAAMIVMWILADWPMWLWVLNAAGGGLALGIGRVADRAWLWPPQLTALCGVLTAWVWAGAMRWLGTGLEPASDAAGLTTLVALTMIGPAAAAVRVGAGRHAGHFAGGVCAGVGSVLAVLCWGARGEGVELTAGRAVLLGAVLLMGFAPVLRLVLARRSRGLSVLVSLALVCFASTQATRAPLVAWGGRFASHPEAYLRGKIMQEDTAGMYVIGGTRNRAVLVLPQGDLTRGRDYVDVLTNPRVSGFEPEAARASRGRIAEGMLLDPTPRAKADGSGEDDVRTARYFELVQRAPTGGTLSGPGLHVLTDSVRNGSGLGPEIDVPLSTALGAWLIVCAAACRSWKGGLIALAAMLLVSALQWESATGALAGLFAMYLGGLAWWRRREPQWRHGRADLAVVIAWTGCVLLLVLGGLAD